MKCTNNDNKCINNTKWEKYKHLCDYDCLHCKLPDCYNPHPKTVNYYCIVGSGTSKNKVNKYTNEYSLRNINFLKY